MANARNIGKQRLSPWPRWLVLLLVVLPLVVLPLGTARSAEQPLQLPELGDASSALISPALERQIGEDFLKQINASLPTSSDPILKYYVERQIARAGSKF